MRWRQDERNRSKVLGRKRAAETLDADLTRSGRTGELAQLKLNAGREPLPACAGEWQRFWRRAAPPLVARSPLAFAEARLEPPPYTSALCFRGWALALAAVADTVNPETRGASALELLPHCLPQRAVPRVNGIG